MNTSFNGRNLDFEFYSKKRYIRKVLFVFDIWFDLGSAEDGLTVKLFASGESSPLRGV